jgi:hypothetical protein
MAWYQEGFVRDTSIRNNAFILMTIFQFHDNFFRTGFAREELDEDSIGITVFENHVFSKKHPAKKPLSEILRQEVEIVKACCRESSLYVYVPIDLQNLPYIKNAVYPWQLSKRPADYVFSALPPFADRIGAPVVRFSNINSAINEDIGNQCGIRIFETYPAASLKQLGIGNSKYKNSIISFDGNEWNGGAKLAAIAQELGFVTSEDTSFNDDDIDASICALTGVLSNINLLKDNELAIKINNDIKKKIGNTFVGNINFEPPNGYVLIKSLPEIKVTLKKEVCTSHKKLLEEILSYS